MGLMANGMTFLRRSLASAGGITSLVITPIDGLGTITITDDAILGNQEVDVTQPGQAGSRREKNEQDFLIPVASLVRSSLTVLPAAGDRYAVTINSTAYTFQVMQADGKSAYDFTDHGRTQVRVRTKKV